MPHIIIEHCESISSAEQLMTVVDKGALCAELFEPNDIKIRAMSFKHHQSGTSSLAFIHVTARILSGRTLAQRQQLSACILDELKALNLREISLTVEVVEIEKQSYAKSVIV